MARKNGNDKKQSPKEQLDMYKKEIGKKYMDGLISDKEYEKLLHEKETELELTAPPVVSDSENGPECPSCGALVSPMDTECLICGIALTPALTETAADAEPLNRDVPENWREEWIDKPFRHLSPEELLKQPPDVLKGVSSGDSVKMKDAFNVRTVEDFATIKFLAWAEELVELKNDPRSFKKENFEHKLIKKYENKGLDELLKAPTYALQGVSEGDAQKLIKAFNTKTIEELGSLKYLKWANRIYDMAPPKVFKVGDRVLMPSGEIGTVTYATEPDGKRLQKVEVAVI